MAQFYDKLEMFIILKIWFVNVLLTFLYKYNPVITELDSESIVGIKVRTYMHVSKPLLNINVKVAYNLLLTNKTIIFRFGRSKSVHFLQG